MNLIQEQNKRAHIALNRFGLGAKPGGILRIRADAKAALEAELNKPDIALINRPSLPNYAEACRVVHTDGEDALKERELTARIAQHLVPEIGFLERLVLFFSNHFSMSVAAVNLKPFLPGASNSAKLATMLFKMALAR